MIETKTSSPRTSTRTVHGTATPFRCPSCRVGALLTWGRSLGAACDGLARPACWSLQCGYCAEMFRMHDGGIPDLLRAVGDEEAVAHQAEHFDEAVDPEFEIERPRGAGALYQALIESKFRRGIAALPFPLAGTTVLDVCCGSGMGAEAYAARGAVVTGVDVSLEALRRAHERARRRSFGFEAVLADAGNLPFLDRTFDVVVVHDGLHHLPCPALGIDEMARVARRAVVVIEPAASPITRWAVHHGLAAEVEECGNRIHRFGPGEVE
ncbi:MAG: class I SAM-dependent methyltransferase, partial [Planctomycetota bacterium]